MPYSRSDMLYNDGSYYKWTAKDDSDNPYYRGGTDRAQLNRTEGYEVLYFINHLASKRWNQPVNLGTYQKIERMIRYAVPSDIRNREAIENWIVSNWNSFS